MGWRTTTAMIGGAATIAVVALAAAIGPASLSPPAAATAPPAAHSAGLVTDPSGLVDPIDGTGTGPVSPGTVGEFPGADLPFGMLQWSPDTSPNIAASGGLYSYADSHITGFSLTHLSGTGCAAYGDVPILPTVGAIPTSPGATTDAFSHASETASPGRYGVTLEPAGIATELSVTERTGISRFDFPRTPQADLLFKVAGSANPVAHASFQMVGRQEITGQVTSGQFCGTGTNYTLYFVAQFDRPAATMGSWRGPHVSPGASRCTGDTCGAYVTFNTLKNTTVLMKVGISFVSVANAADNLRAENPDWSLSRVEASATRSWNSILSRIRIGGGTATQQRTFYTALYHSLLHPNVVSDDNGEYTGEDGKVHRSATRAQYANFSEWDIYRSEIELASVVAPHQVGDMVQSLVNDAQQDGWLPKWAIADGDASQMNGDSADPIIAAAYAFGVRDFDVTSALSAMVKGATRNETAHGLEIERQYLSEYISQHYVNADSLDLTSIDYSIGGSVTLEYAIDDFAIAQLAQSLGDNSLATKMMQRAHNWEYEFNPATGYVQARATDGSFPSGPAFSFSDLDPGGQVGFEEGNAIQYTWSVPQDLAALASLMGGDSQAVKQLNSFFTNLNVTRYYPYDWAGNEPSLWSPWEYDYFGDPSGAQGTVRRIVNTLYADAPVDEPGNDDLGALSSWYVWAAIGLYPVTPGAADLAVASPLFPHVVLTLPDGRRIVSDAPAAAASTPYIHSLKVSGVAPPKPAVPAGCTAPGTPPETVGSWNSPWLPASVLTSGATLTYGLSATPDAAWGSAPSLAPPSFGAGAIADVGYAVPSGGTSVNVGQAADVQLGVAAAVPGAATITWTATATAGTVVFPRSGSIKVSATQGCGGGTGNRQNLLIKATTAGQSVVTIHLTNGAGASLPPVVLDVAATS